MHNTKIKQTKMKVYIWLMQSLFIIGILSSCQTKENNENHKGQYADSLHVDFTKEEMEELNTMNKIETILKSQYTLDELYQKGEITKQEKDWSSKYIHLRFFQSSNCTLQNYTVCIDHKEFSGYTDSYDIPFVGTVGRGIKEIYVNNKKVEFKHSGELFFRQKIKLAMGYNRIPVKIVGQEGTSNDSYYIEITLETQPDKTIEINVK